jgi:streptomycin 6-kinase
MDAPPFPKRWKVGAAERITAPPAIMDQAIAYGCLSASWHHQDCNTLDETRGLSIAAAIRTVRLSL